MNDVGRLPAELGVSQAAIRGGALAVRSPIDGATLAQVTVANAGDAQRAIAQAHDAFLVWRNLPAPLRVDLRRAISTD